MASSCAKRRAKQILIPSLRKYLSSYFDSREFLTLKLHYNHSIVSDNLKFKSLSNSVIIHSNCFVNVTCRAWNRGMCLNFETRFISQGRSACTHGSWTLDDISKCDLYSEFGSFVKYCEWYDFLGNRFIAHKEDELTQECLGMWDDLYRSTHYFYQLASIEYCTFICNTKYWVPVYC